MTDPEVIAAIIGIAVLTATGCLIAWGVWSSVRDWREIEEAWQQACENHRRNVTALEHSRIKNTITILEYRVDRLEQRLDAIEQKIEQETV